MTNATTAGALFLLTVSVFDDRAIMAWSTIVDGHESPIQHIGRASITTWMNTFGSILETDRVRVSVVDRRQPITR